MIREIKMMVGSINSNGEPDFFFCRVMCSDLEYENGSHYTTACLLAAVEGYEPHFVFDENDPAGKAIVDKFVWETASVTTCG